MPEILYGRNAARECLRAKRRHIHTVLLADSVQSSPTIREIQDLAKRARIPVQQVSRKRLDSMVKGHQGVVLEAGRYPTVNLEIVLDRAVKLDESPFIMVVDHIEDPHNLGAILRTAEIVGIHGVLIPKQRAVGITPTVVNTSAGAAEHMWVVEVPNLVQVLKKLKQQNIWIAGVEDSPTSVPYQKANLTGPLALVIGSEGKGMSRLVRETCDFLVKLPMRGQIESLNASVAAALVLYEVWRARDFG